MSRSDNANTLMPAAVSVLKLLGSDGQSRGVTSLMAELPQVKAEEWPGVKAGAEAKSEPRSRGWTRHKMSSASGSGMRGGKQAKARCVR